MNKPQVPKKLPVPFEIGGERHFMLLETLNALSDCVEWLMENVIPLDPKECQLEMNELKTEWLDKVRDTIKASFETLGDSCKSPEPKYCCDLFLLRVSKKEFAPSCVPGKWFIVRTNDTLTYCPFCGRKLVGEKLK